MSRPAYPGSDTAPSYNGREVAASCPQCHHRAYIPDPTVFGSEGHCTGCHDIVTWVVW